MHVLLDHLAAWPPDGSFQTYTFQQIHGGANNFLYKVSGPDGDFAVKFTLRDGRRRAWREFQALTALQACGLALAPAPILLDEDRYASPVRPEPLRQLVQTLSYLPNELPPARLALCRVDPNTLNFVRRPGFWASVDWENSGWGDPTFEMADLMTHPQYAAVLAERWEWVIELYTGLVGDKAAAVRIRTYYPLMLIWWVARLARMLYEVPLGHDERLVPRDPDWQQTTEEKMARYIDLAFQAIHKL